jgi:antitoxin component HigA of HigAB toxin-antitoxin module
MEMTMASVVLDFSKPHLLRSPKEFKAAVAEIDRLLDADVRRGTDSYDRLEFLSVLVRRATWSRSCWSSME